MASKEMEAHGNKEGAFNDTPPAYSQGYSQVPQQAQYYPGGVQAGQPYPGQQVIVQQPVLMANAPSDHMMYSILTTLCCCWPIGIFAILRSLEVQKAVNRGDLNSAVVHSRRAKSLGNWALVVGIAFTVLWLIGVGVYMALIFTGHW